jgi:plasmid stability protein
MTERVQKMARINVDPDAWSALRIRALQHNRSLADVLGELIEQTVNDSPPLPRAAQPAKPTRHRRLTPAVPPGTPTGESALTPPGSTKGEWVPPWEV